MVDLPRTRYQTWELKDEVIYLNDENGILAAFPLHKMDESGRIRVLLKTVKEANGESQRA